MVFLFIGNKLFLLYAFSIFYKSALFLKEVDIYLLKHINVVYGCDISKPDYFVSKSSNELAYI